MNILIPHTWLLEHLDTSTSPRDIQKYLSLCGPSVERIYDKNGDSVYDMEVTTNRVDMMSIRGIAREAAVILQQFELPAQLRPLKIPPIAKPTTQLPLPKIVNNPQLCHRIQTIILTNVTHTPTPQWMADRLLQIDQSVHDSAIDITNYVTHELGHPCHAFDYDKIMKLGGEIRVVEAEAGWPFTTLDGVKYTTKGGEVVFVNPDGTIIDLPAIKGTANTAVDDTTNTILFWIESIDARKVRFGSMSHAIRTVAAQLNEKNVDPHAADDVLAQAVAWYQDLCHASIASAVYDDFPGQKTPQQVVVPASTIASYLGVTLPAERITQILSDLGCEVSLIEDTYRVTPPTYRPDIEIPADVVEEIARIYGYHNLPSVLMPTAIPLKKPAHVNYAVENLIKHFLADTGLFEIYSYSMVSETLAARSGHSVASHLKLANPLTDDRVYLRRSLIPSLEEVFELNPQSTTLSVFEVANIYPPQKGSLPDEHQHLTIVSSLSYRQLRGVVEDLLQQLHVGSSTVVADAQPATGFETSGSIIVTENNQKVAIGSIGRLPSGRMAAQIVLRELLKVTQHHPTYEPLAKTMPVIEDLTFTVPAETPVGAVLSTVKSVSPLIKLVALKDIYRQNITITVHYQTDQENVSDSQVSDLRQKIVAKVHEVHAGSLVGKIE